MTWELDPIPTQPTTAGYLDAASAAPLLAQMPGLARLRAADAGTQDAALLLASIEVDAAGPYQGRKYSLSQEREFPRIPHPESANNWFAPLAPLAGGRPEVWDWDNDAGQAVVPDVVKIAVLHQAESLLDTARAARLDKIRDGLTSVSVGSLSESYAQQIAAAGPLEAWNNLCRPAQALMARYRLTTGPML